MKPNELLEKTRGEGLNFALPETHQLLREWVRQFAEAEIAHRQRANSPVFPKPSAAASLRRGIENRRGHSYRSRHRSTHSDPATDAMDNGLFVFR